MSWLSLLMLGFAMSADAFAAALGKGAGMTRPTLPQAMRIGVIFGVVESLTPIVGWLLGTAASRYIERWDHWIAFGLLAALGIHMIWKSLREDRTHAEAAVRKGGIFALALTGLATSIDAMAVGVSLAFIDVSIWIAAGIIGVCTFLMVTVGVMVGRALGVLVGKRAEMIGGIILVLVGAGILYEHLVIA